MKQLTMAVLSVLALCIAAQPVAVHAAAQKAAAAKTMKATGTVKSVSGTQLVVSSSGKDMTFMVDGGTKFTGKGLTTKSKGKPMASTDAVHEGDQVTVSYHDMGGMMHAANVTITAASMNKK
jgi:outer membrane lipoprotein-sorting protein